jgi:hypothetical protein
MQTDALAHILPATENAARAHGRLSVRTTNFPPSRLRTTRLGPVNCSAAQWLHGGDDPMTRYKAPRPRQSRVQFDGEAVPGSPPLACRHIEPAHVTRVPRMVSNVLGQRISAGDCEGGRNLTVASPFL